MAFFWPWLLVLIPMPIFLKLFWRSKNRLLRHQCETPSLRIPTYNVLVQESRTEKISGGLNQKQVLLWLIWILLVISAAQPLWLGDRENIPVSGRDLMFLVDTSGSMRQMDFIRLDQSHQTTQQSKSLTTQSIDSFNNLTISRLDLVKQLAAEFIKARQGDRIGFILFGQRPHVRAALSYDHQAIVQLILESEIALAGESTAIGDAIGLAVKRMRTLPSKSRVLVLLTDGANNEGLVNPEEAAILAASEGIRIYTIGIGKSDVPSPNPYGVWSAENAHRFEESVLKNIAHHSGGHYFHVLDSEGLKMAYDRLNDMEPALHPQNQKHLAYSMYPWILSIALLLSLWGIFTHKLIPPTGGRYG